MVRFYNKRIRLSVRRERESELKVIDLFELHPTPMVVYDAESHLLLAINEATAEQYGYRAEELIGKPLLTLATQAIVRATPTPFPVEEASASATSPVCDT